MNANELEVATGAPQVAVHAQQAPITLSARARLGEENVTCKGETGKARRHGIVSFIASLNQ